MEVMTAKEASTYAETLNDKELMTVKNIYSLLENLVRIEDPDGDFDNGYAGDNTCVTELTMELIQQCRNQLEWQKQSRGWR